jgi:chromosomal replication initiator protein
MIVSNVNLTKRVIDTVNTTEEASPEKVMQAICRHFKIHPKHVNSENRKADAVYPRQLYFYFLRKRTRLTFEQIGNTLTNKKSHGTVMYSIKRINDISMYADVRKDISKVHKKLNCLI